MKLTLLFILTAILYFNSTIAASQSIIPDIKHDIETAIKALQPSLSDERVDSMAAAFKSVSLSNSCRISWQTLVSIAFIESSLGLNMYNAASHDYGLMQINIKNIKRHNLSKDRLMRDDKYSIKFACKLLKENKDRYASRLPYWLGLYRSGTALYREEIRQNAMQYDKIVRDIIKKVRDTSNTRVAMED